MSKKEAHGMQNRFANHVCGNSFKNRQDENSIGPKEIKKISGRKVYNTNGQ